MSSRNDESTGMVTMFLLFGVLIAFVGKVVLVLLAIGAGLLFVLAFIASVHPITIGGQTMTSEEGRRFLWRGLLCTMLSAIPLEILFDAFGISKNWEYIPHCMFIAGAAGALLWEHLRNGTPPAVKPEELPPALPRQAPPPAPAPFEFASWDDEEKRQ